MLTFLYVLAGFVLLILAYLVLANDHKNRSNRIFFLFLIAGLFWLVSNLAVNLSNNEAVALAMAQLSVATSVLIFVAFAFFVDEFAKTKVPKYVSAAGIVLGVGVSALSFTEFTVESATAGGEEVLYGPGFALVGAALVILFFYCVIRLMGLRQRTRGISRSRVVYMLFGITSAFLIGLGLNAVLPVLGFSEAAKFGALSVVFFAIPASIAMIRHGLFDIRVVVARSLAYILAVGSLLAAFLSISYLILTDIVNTENASQTQIYYLTLSIVLALLLQPTKGFFDKLTNRIFFRESFDAQDRLNEFSDFLATEIDIDKVASKTIDLLNDTVRPSKSFILLYEGDEKKWRELNGRIAIKSKIALEKALEYQTKTLIITEDENSFVHDPFQENIANSVREQGVEVSIKLSTREELVGFLLLGGKKSGDRYRDSDFKFMTIMANQLSIALENAKRFDEIEQFNVVLQEKIKNATKELRETNEKLQELDEAKDEFISMASHQLRTPLTSIKGYISMIMEGDLGPVDPKQKEMLHAALTSSTRMVYLIGDFLNASRLKTGKFVIEPTEVLLHEMVESEVETLQDTAKARGLKIVYTKPKVFPAVMLDDNKIRQVIMNFIDNAIFYSKPKGIIKVEVGFNKQSVFFQVTDDGIGVPKEDQKNLFTKFYRGSNARKARPDGTGLGIFMAKKVVVAQGGAIIFSSKEGKGSTFGFTFPLEKVKVGNN